ncbi:cytochrome P450, partial [Trifolium medium]|nr:cytochrome P450 [Trifolium medium]
GPGREEKRKEVRKLVGEKNPVILCIQETKLGVCDDFLCASLWGNSPHDFFYRLLVGASGGLLIMWDTVEVEVWSPVSSDHVLMIHGWFLKDDEEFFLLNIYAPCDNGAKQILWDSLTSRLQQLGGKNVCACDGPVVGVVRSLSPVVVSRRGKLGSPPFADAEVLARSPRL